MERIHTIGIALVAAVCMAAAPSLGAEKRSASESKSAERTQLRVEKKKAASSAARQKATESKNAATVRRVRDSQPKTRAVSTPKDAVRSDAVSAKTRASTSVRQAPVVQRELKQRGDLGAASSANPTDPASKAAELRAGRKTPGTGSADVPSTSLIDRARSTDAKQMRRPLEPSAAGTVGNPVADPLAKAEGVASPAPTAEQLQARSRAAKGDRTSQASTIFRVNEKKPFHEQGGGIVDTSVEFNIRPVPPKNDEAEHEGSEPNDPDAEFAEEERLAEEEAEEERRAEKEAAEERAELAAAEESADEEAAKQRAEEENTTRPDEASATEYITKMTDEEIAARKAETKAGLVNPTGVGATGAFVDPNRAREIGRSASPRAGWAIDPGSGEASGPAPSPNEVPERPDECDLAGGAAGDCDGGDGLR